MLAQRPDLTRIAAAEFVESRGADALRVLRERAELAEQLGHKVAALTWRQMLANAETLVEAEDPTPTARPGPSEKRPELRC